MIERSKDGGLPLKANNLMTNKTQSRTEATRLYVYILPCYFKDLQVDIMFASKELPSHMQYYTLICYVIIYRRNVSTKLFVYLVWNAPALNPCQEPEMCLVSSGALATVDNKKCSSTQDLLFIGRALSKAQLFSVDYRVVNNRF